MGPNPRGEVHVSPPPFLSTGNRETEHSTGAISLQVEASPCGTRSQASPREFFGVMELFCIPSVLVVTRS